jgi:hypothetical protein
MTPQSKSVRAELVEALLFFLAWEKKEQPFDELRANGAGETA